MKVLLCCLQYRTFTGSELYFYELSQGLLELGCEVSLISPRLGEPLKSKTSSVRFISLLEASETYFDHIIFSHGAAVWGEVKNLRAKFITNVLHSEIIELEAPVHDERVDRYIGVRPSIVEHTSVKCDLVYNPFDRGRFNPQIGDGDLNVVCFPGTLDYLRIKPLQHLLLDSEHQGFRVIHVGHRDYELSYPNFTSHPAIWEIEKYYAACDVVAGIMLGRTTIEGLLCGRKALQFDVDKAGEIKRVYWHQETDLDKFDRKTVAKSLINP